MAGTIQRTNTKVTITLDTPITIKIGISERYTKDIIFSAFAQHHAQYYRELLRQEAFQHAITHLQHALEKRSGECYVINMAKAGHHHSESNPRELEVKNILVRFNDTSNLQQLKNVLYQIRCNVFHGEKSQAN